MKDEGACPSVPPPMDCIRNLRYETNDMKLPTTHFFSLQLFKELAGFLKLLRKSILFFQSVHSLL